MSGVMPTLGQSVEERNDATSNRARGDVAQRVDGAPVGAENGRHGPGDACTPATVEEGGLVDDKEARRGGTHVRTEEAGLAARREALLLFVEQIRCVAHIGDAFEEGELVH